MNEASVTRNIAEDRYELKIDNDVAVAVYHEQGHIVTLTHTEVPGAREGQGVASKLIAGALDDVRRRGLKIVPECRFVAAYVQRHPQVQGLLAS